MRDKYLPSHIRKIPVPKHPTTIGGHLRRRRLQLKIYQPEAARLLQVSTVTLSRWECDKVAPDTAALRADCRLPGLQSVHQKGLKTLKCNEPPFVAFLTLWRLWTGPVQNNEPQGFVAPAIGTHEAEEFLQGIPACTDWATDNDGYLQAGGPGRLNWRPHPSREHMIQEGDGAGLHLDSAEHRGRPRQRHRPARPNPNSTAVEGSGTSVA